jgi:hypothetical protein
LRLLASGGDQYLDAAIDDVLHLLLMPVAGIGEQHLGAVADAGGLELALGGVEHRFEVPEVRCGGHHFGGDDDLVLVGDGLGTRAGDGTALRMSANINVGENVGGRRSTPCSGQKKSPALRGFH